MTEKLYYADAYCKVFSANVTGCTRRKDGYEITLDRTAFYPEGGGQPADHGMLFSDPEDSGNVRVLSAFETQDFEMKESGRKGRAAVLDVQEREGEIFHYTDAPLEIGTAVKGQIDWERRFDLMQNHSGEHIVSGLIHEKLGYQNVGFHMGSDVLTIDLDGEFSVEEMQSFERRANEIVWADLPADIRMYREEEVKTLEYRSKKELHGEVRIVSFPGADVCACCGMHVGRTGEIGLIKLISLQKFKGGVRMEMLCGRRAFAYVNAICEQNHQVSVALSAKPKETAEAVLRLKASAAKENFRAVAMENELFALKANTLENAGNVLLFEDGLSPDSLRKLAVAVMEQCRGCCAVFSGEDESGYKYAIGKTDGDLRELVKELNSSLNGRGGGKPFFAQGSVSAGRGRITDFFAEKGFHLK